MTSHRPVPAPAAVLLSRRSVMVAGLATMGAVFAPPGLAAAARATGTGRAAEGTASSLIATPIHNVAVNSAAFGQWPDGREVAYFAVNGGPATLAALDIRANEQIDQAVLDGAAGAWGTVVAPDGVVYVGSWDNGHLYRYEPGSGTAEDLGRPIESETYIWRIDVDDRGRIYGGTYPSGALFRYDPRSGEVRDYGRIADGSDYGRSVAVDGDTVYVGLGSERARLFAVDAESGDREEIELPAEYRDHTFIYSLEVRGGLLFVWVTTPNDPLLVLDTATRQFIDDLGPAAGSVSVSPVHGREPLYYVAADGTWRWYDPRTGDVGTTPVSDSYTARSFGWVHRAGAGARPSSARDYPGHTLAMADYLGRLWYYNPRTGAHETVDTPIEGAPANVQSIGVGPDGKVYVSGYQSGGLAVVDPATSESIQFPAGTVGQVEGMHTHGDKLYLGVYTGSVLLAFDPSLPFDYGTNPYTIAVLEEDGQDRPFAWTSAGDLVATGTVPGYGDLGGALTLIDPSTDDYHVHRDVVPEQSITALTSLDGQVVGGTSVWGGLGVPPTQSDAVLFGWDTGGSPGGGTKAWEVVPVTGERAITGLTVTPDGHVWGVTVGKVFEYVPATGEVARVIEIAPFDWTDVSHVWASGQVEGRDDGTLLVLALGTLYTLDPASGAVTELQADVKHFVVTPDGEIVFSRGTDLYRYEP